MSHEKVKFLLNWNHFGEHLSLCMTKLMTDSSYSDIIIATADKRMIYSHRFVLANSSKYFQRLLKHMNKQRGTQLVVALPEIKYEIFKILMNYMYKGETQVPHELLPSVIKAGQFLEINGLVNLNENESNGNNEAATKSNPAGDTVSKNSLNNSSNSNSNNDSNKARVSSTLRDKIHSRENTNNSSKNVSPVEKRAKRRNGIDSQSPDLQTTEENGKENRSKLTKTSKFNNLSREKKDYIQLPLKRKSSLRESVKKTSTPSPSSSSPMESLPPKKIQKRHTSFKVSQEVVNVKVKDEKESSPNPTCESRNLEIQEEKITIKMEAPDEIEDVYNELQCDFCHEVYTSPSDWVRHMTEQHGDRGYQAYKDLDKSVGSSAVITCVVCSCVFFSAAEWAKHLRMWHTERELAVANMGKTKKGSRRVKKN